MKHQIGIIVFGVIATTLANALPVRAETIFLKCGDMDTLSVDLAAHTVNNTPASITPIEIDWHNINQYADVHLHIDRTSGSYSMSGTYFRPEGNIPIPYSAPVSCTSVTAPATKF
jgi:hypothetical protein